MSLVTPTRDQFVPHTTLEILTIPSEMGAEQLSSSIRNESTESVQHYFVDLYSTGH